MWQIVISIVVVLVGAEPVKITIVPDKPLVEEAGTCLHQGDEIAEQIAADVDSRGLTALRVQGLDGKNFVSAEIKNSCGRVEVKLARN